MRQGRDVIETGNSLSRRDEAKEWAQEGSRGAGNVIPPSFRRDLLGLNEAEIRHDIARNIELGFWGALLGSEAGTTLDEMHEFMEIAVDEAAGRQYLILQGMFDTAADIIGGCPGSCSTANGTSSIIDQSKVAAMQGELVFVSDAQDINLPMRHDPFRVLRGRHQQPRVLRRSSTAHPHPPSRRKADGGPRAVGFDPDRDRAAAASAEGVVVAPSLDQLWELAGTVVLLAVRTGEQLCEVAGHPLVASRRRVVVVLSTVGPATMVAVTRQLNSRKVDVVDAPVSGGVEGARSGRLTVMVSSMAPLERAVRDVLEDLGEVMPVGQKPGAGQAVKLANQVAMAGAMAAAVEAVAIADASGVERTVLRDVLLRSTGRSWAIEHLPRVLDMWQQGATGPFGLLSKDLQLAREASVKVAPAPTIAALVERLSGL